MVRRFGLRLRVAADGENLITLPINCEYIFVFTMYTLLLVKHGWPLPFAFTPSQT